jgi:hypothetical protein
MPIRKNADGNQYGTFSDVSVDSGLFVSCIENQVLDLIQLAGPLDVQFVIEQLGGSTDPSTGDIQSAEFPLCQHGVRRLPQRKLSCRARSTNPCHQVQTAQIRTQTSCLRRPHVADFDAAYRLRTLRRQISAPSPEKSGNCSVAKASLLSIGQLVSATG